MPKPKLGISLGVSVYDNSIIQKKISLQQLFKRLSQPDIRDKKDGKYFIFASFKKNIRTASNIDRYYGASIDLDDTPLSLKQIRAKFAKYQHCIYTTFNHRVSKKGDRYRLVLPYKTPLDPTTHVETMLYLMDMLGASNVDLSSKALARPMYLPSTTSKRRRHFEFFPQLSGLCFNPSSQVIRDKVAALHFKQGESGKGDNRFDINTDVIEGDRNNALSRAVGKFIHTGVAISELQPLAEAWNEAKLSPPLSAKEVEVIVESIVKAHTRNHDDLEWGYDEVITRIRKSADIISDYDHILDIIVLAKTKGKLKKSQVELAIIELQKKTRISKGTIKQELTIKELELVGRLEEASNETFESVTKSLREDFADWVYVASDDRVYHIKTGEYYKREAFAAMYATPAVEGSLFATTMKYSLMKKVSRLEFDPAEVELYVRGGVRYANTYIYPEVFPLPGDVNPILKHFRYLIPERYERGIFLDFIAHLVQHPGVKIRWMPVIKGGKGIGKTIIAEKIIMPIIGFTNFGKVSNNVIRSDFNAWQLDKQLVVFEELDIGDSYKEKLMLTDSLKAFITDNILTAHRKGLDPYDTINKANSMGFTNKEDAIIITPDERRFCMIRTSASPKSDEYYQQLANFADKNLSEIYYYFLERDLSNFSPLRAPDTEYTREVKSLSMSWPGSIVSAWLTDSTHPVCDMGCASNHQIIDLIKVESTGRYKTLADDLQNPGSKQSKNLYHTLRNLGFDKYFNPEVKDGRVRTDGKMQTVWLTPGAALELKSASSKMIRKRINSIKIVDPNWQDS